MICPGRGNPVTSETEPPSGTFRNGSHAFPVRVYYEDTDAGGIVYHADYLRYAERARTEMLRCLGIEHGDMLAAHQVFFVVREMHARFHTPARLDDVLEVLTEPGPMTGARLRLRQTIRTADRVLVELALTLACVSPAGRARRWPGPVAAKFASLNGS